MADAAGKEALFESLLVRAANDDATAWREIAAMAERGEGMKEPNLKWTFKALVEGAVKGGDPECARNLARAFEDGVGCTPDPKKAAVYLMQAADAGDVLAMRLLGGKYSMGAPGLPQSWPKAAEWFSKAAALGDARSMAVLGGIYFKGKLGKKDYRLAADWLERALFTGQDVDKALCHLHLGILYMDDDHGVKSDLNKAANHIEKAAKLGDPVAPELLAHVRWLQEISAITEGAGIPMSVTFF